MAKNDETEEKRLPPSRIKLDRLRRDGQVPRSRDVPTALSVLAVVTWLAWGIGSLIHDFTSTFEAALQIARGPAGIEVLTPVLGEMGAALLQIVWAPLLLGLVVAVIASIVDAQGFPVSMKHMALDFARLNPAEGLKKIFSLNSLAEFLKGIAKLVLLCVAGAGTLLYFLNGVFWSPLCGEACSLSVAVHLVGTIVVISAVIMLVAAFFDLRISRALFRHEHRMTRTEARREQKEAHGDPHIRSARRQIGAEMRNSPPRKHGPGAK
ncbi:EscU/YscU/HrcU family type III secretion system export apparatus switch protein [Rhizobium sp. TRM95111]|uniref:EscU/YscU/HrcU family type III secretion system export apparatus switch protein n=1 Tax=Rhizobium alarense TaxID=2846851 RepID=UPI001F18D19B|nr:EscU/YscU/HrcU family type III secretion system export apparatus switch protein [Rhizobium alarense]MCF3641591.1 EscU/YscU/HrcU family type III secretion system export apparatus switch protein [Rhizobium alarense]